VFDHVTIRVADPAASGTFYRLALGQPSYANGEFTEWGNFDIAPAAAEKPVTRRLHVGFGAHNRAEVDSWWERMTGAGYTSDGDPGVRPWYHASYYGAFVLDPEGNSVEAVHHYRSRTGEIDHLWLRTPDVEASRRFYVTIASSVGIELSRDLPELVRWSDGEGSFSFVAGDEPTENVHLAFGVPDVAAVARFHEAAIAAGYRDNGPPGERPHYHPGYHGAFVFDPDGHNVEAVFHDRSV
jgi:catechol 2,3-dioxygenase-like lactoylglutathione lyase family enzyme